MRDYDPTTGRYFQGDPLGLVDGPSVYGYAWQNPGRYMDPTGEAIPALAVAMAMGGAAGVGIGYMMDLYLGDGCYTWSEAFTDFVFGAAFSGAGFAATGVRKAGTEFSHTIPKRWLDKFAAGRRFDKRNKPMRALNGNYVKPRTHAKTDFHRRVKGMAARDMYPAGVRHALRTPLWLAGGPAGAAASNVLD